MRGDAGTSVFRIFARDKNGKEGKFPLSSFDVPPPPFSATYFHKNEPPPPHLNGLGDGCCRVEGKNKGERAKRVAYGCSACLLPLSRSSASGPLTRVCSFVDDGGEEDEDEREASPSIDMGERREKAERREEREREKRAFKTRAGGR